MLTLEFVSYLRSFSGTRAGLPDRRDGFTGHFSLTLLGGDQLLHQFQERQIPFDLGLT